MNVDWIIPKNQFEDVLDLLSLRALELQPLHS
jgi:hypothetical protein